MTQIQLKDAVRAAIRSGWDAFAQDHPRLAQVLDEQLLVEQATQSISDDPQYQETMSQASLTGIAAESLLPLIQKLVTRWLWNLV
jgi:hypothetical protein